MTTEPRKVQCTEVKASFAEFPGWQLFVPFALVEVCFHSGDLIFSPVGLQGEGQWENRGSQISVKSSAFRCNSAAVTVHCLRDWRHLWRRWIAGSCCYSLCVHIFVGVHISLTCWNNLRIRKLILCIWATPVHYFTMHQLLCCNGPYDAALAP